MTTLGAVIVGVGRTRFSRESGRPVVALAAEAAITACQDAGVPLDAIDGIATFHENDSVSTSELADILGVGTVTWNLEWLAGGAVSCAVIAEAAKAIAVGDSRVVLVYRAMNGASGFRMGSFGQADVSERSAFTLPYGFGTPVQWFAMACRRYMHEYGVSAEDLGRVAVEQRRHANRNPRAVMHRRTLSLEDYFNSRFVAEPLRLMDCCQETDGAVALILVDHTDARALKRQGVSVAASAYAMAPFSSLPLEKYESWSHVFAHWLARRLFSDAGMRPDDIDLACLYDAFTFNVPCQLEDFGFCSKGDAGSFIDSGAITLDGPLPVNTHGGLLSEGYVHGLNGVAEAVDQLRGECGDRQVSGAKTALVSGYGFSRGSAVILAT